MHFHRLITSYLKFMVVIVIHVLPASVCDSIDQYYNCSQYFQCGTLLSSLISYPFWGENRPEYCGRPGFQLYCQLHDDAPLLTIHSTTYRVLDYSNTEQTLTVARDEFWKNYCPMFLYNATLDTTDIFKYASNTLELRLYYGCSPLSGQHKILNQFECSVNGTTTIGYYATTVNPILETPCNNSVIVPVFRSAVEGLTSNPPSINISEALAQGFALQWSDDDCGQCVQSGGQCGYNSSSSSFTCYCFDQSYPLMCSTTEKTYGIVVRVTIAAGVFLVGLGIILIIRYIRRKCLLYNTMNFRKEQTLKDQNVEVLIRNCESLALNRYKYSDIKRITNSFKEKLGQGGFGGVYKGKLSDGRLVAVKLLSETKGGNGEDFVNEVASIIRTSHVNVVTLLGFCYQVQKRALVYEFMPNGSLDKFIINNGSLSTNSHLECKNLYQIAIGIARGLEYLHQGCNTRIVHFDIKPHNILLDEDFCPKISDFGLAKLCQRRESILSMKGARGTIGYIAPEVFCRNFGGVSYKSDVYSYGMMVIEMIGARERVEVGSNQTSETYFPDWIYEHLENGKDLRLNIVTTEEEKETARKMILVSLWCIQTNPSDRPTMSKVVEMLEGSLESLQIPPQPYLLSTIQSIQDSSITLSEVLGKHELPIEHIT